MPLVEPAQPASHGLSLDASGRLFEWNGRLLRGIAPGAVARVRALFECGLVEALVRERLLVGSRLSELQAPGFPLVVEHERVTPLIYPYEWSFSMLRDAALAVLEVNRIARRYGYETRDCHGYNVCFDGTQPLYVDLGSFHEVRDGFAGWSAYEEFLSFYDYPLRIWRGGNHFLARRALLGCGLGDRLTPEGYLLYAHPFLRPLSGRRLALLSRMLVHGARLRAGPRQLATLARRAWQGRLRGEEVQALQRVDFAALARRIRRIGAPRGSGRWAGYQSAYAPEALSPRFERVRDLLEAYGARSIVELAGNRGVLSLALAAMPSGPEVACTDSDEAAVDALYRSAKAAGRRVAPAVHDFMFPMTNFAGNRPANERLRAEAVVALAVTHHLVLGQGLPFQHVLRTIAGYAERFILVEFMPLGLHSPGDRVEVPDWYREDGFRRAFEAVCDLDGVERLEENRVLFYGRVRKAPDR